MLRDKRFYSSVNFVTFVHSFDIGTAVSICDFKCKSVTPVFRDLLVYTVADYSLIPVTRFLRQP